MSVLIRRNTMLPGFTNFFDDFFTKDLFDWNDKNFMANDNTLPLINVKETENDFEIELAAPGMKKEDFQIVVDKKVLTISSNKKDETETKGQYTHREFNYQSFSRSFTLPVEVVESDKIEASYKEGILYITVPKKETAKPQPVKSIAVN